MFLTRFFIGNLFCSILVCMILLVKKAFRKQLSIKCHYSIWFILLAALIGMLMPISCWNGF